MRIYVTREKRKKKKRKKIHFNFECKLKTSESAEYFWHLTVCNCNTEETTNSSRLDNRGSKELAAGGVCSRGSISFSGNLDFPSPKYILSPLSDYTIQKDKKNEDIFKQQGKNPL